MRPTGTAAIRRLEAAALRSLRALPLLVAALFVGLPPAAARAAGEAEASSRDTETAPLYELHFDADLGAESGARNLAAAVTLIGSGEERLFRPLDRGPGRPGAGGIALHVVRTIVWDAPVAWWSGTALHEAFGHGGRGREFNAGPSVHLGSPWQGRTSFATFDPTGRSTEELLYIWAGGAEANGLAATRLERRVVAGVRMRPIDLLFLVSNRLVTSDYVLRTTPSPRGDPGGFYREYAGGGDVANYLGLLHELHGDGSGITPAGVDDGVHREYSRLRRQAYWNTLDPGVWWALASALRMSVRGDDARPLPLPRLGRYRVLPILSSEWTPSGGQTSLEWAAAREGTSRWFSLVARRGRGPSGAFGALGAAADRLIAAGPLALGGMAEAWHDPRNGFGGGARLRARVERGALRGLYVDVGIKSQGYWVGQPATPGPYGAFGVRLGP